MTTRSRTSSRGPNNRRPTSSIPPICHHPRCAWATPRWVIEPLDAEFGFDVDVCATASNAKAPSYFSKRENGLLVPRWGAPGSNAWMNCPYCQAPLWAAKAWDQSRLAITVVGLFPSNRMEQPWWTEYVCRAAEVRPIRKRVSHIPPPGVTASSPRFGSAVVIWRPNSEGPPVMTPFGGNEK